MSIITTWKCDGCGRISRREADVQKWIGVSVEGPPDDHGYHRYLTAHVCSPGCISSIRPSFVDEVEALLEAR